MLSSDLDPSKRVVSLSCACQTYGWGKIGEESKVAQLVKDQPGFQIDNDTPYAELWMGTHKNAPSKLLTQSDNEEVELADWIKINPSVLGEDVARKFGPTLPYLFKVLSINKSLSIQAHPTKEHAEALHAERPDVYKDPNHKPEMAIALTKFEALCGFRPVSEILNYFHEVEEILSMVGQDAVDELIKAEAGPDLGNKSNVVQKALKHCVSCLMEHDACAVRECLNRLVQRLDECHSNGEDTTLYLGHLFLRIHSEFPGDVGCFMIYFLNYLQLEPYESIFLSSNIPHSYISGDIIECMACSDNVVRAGLTPKYKDVQTLINMLDYTPRTIAETMFQPVQHDGDVYASVYDPPVADFSVKMIKIPNNSLSKYVMKAINGPSICLTVTGEVTAQYNNSVDSLKLHRGSICFIGCGEEICLTDISSDEELLMFQAYCELQ